ncbi:B12-binding domain-containing radical SAM protein [Candidatus Micrarchaeota archaeon]|nr:B12-binding domain-containing radical SAM protein [Candidatus Micrarchaeota archaeon]
MKVRLVSVYNLFESPPIGLASLSTYAKEYGGFKPEIVDGYYCRDLFKKIQQDKPDLVGITSDSVLYEDATVLAKRIKEEMDLSIVVGGPHITTLPQSLRPVFDAGIIGEGEQTFLEVLESFESRGSLDGGKEIKGLVYWRKKKLEFSAPRELIMPLDKIPPIDYSLLDKRHFRRKPLSFDYRPGIEGNMFTSRGCPYRCVFCSGAQLYKHPRFFSVDHVIEEMKTLIEKYGCNHIQIWDDMYTISKKRMRDIAQKMKEERVQERCVFSVQGRVNHIDKEVCDILKDTGVTMLSFGFESGSDRILRYLKKESVSAEDNRKAIRLCREAGFYIAGSLIFASPGEKLEDMKKTLEFMEYAQKEGVMNMRCYILTPFPRTDVWEIAKARGLVSEEMDFRKLGMFNIEDPPFLDPGINKGEFKKLFDMATKKGYQMSGGVRRMFLAKLADEPLNVIKRALRNPRRAVAYLRNLFGRRDLS